jgi:hypothetical protein
MILSLFHPLYWIVKGLEPGPVLGIVIALVILILVWSNQELLFLIPRSAVIIGALVLILFIISLRK